MKEVDTSKRSPGSWRVSRARKRMRLFQAIFLICIVIINIKFIIYGLRRSSSSDKDILIVSSTFVCDAAGSSDCATKQWVRQNSFENWRQASSDVLLLEDHESDCEKLPRGVRCQKHHCEHPSLGLPNVKCLIMMSMELYPKNVVVFTNDDILFKGLQETVNTLAKNFGQFVAVGRRTNVPLNLIITIDEISGGGSNRSVDIEELSSGKYMESAPYELDYFVFNIDRNILEKYPDFVLGNWRWDNVMVDFLLLNNVTLIDISKSVTAYHLGRTTTKQDFRKGARYNDDLMWKYFEDTNNRVTFEGDIDPILRFGSMTYTQYETTQPPQQGQLELVKKHPPVFA